MINGLGRLFRPGASAFSQARLNIALAAHTELPPAERYALQRAYFGNNGLYEELSRLLYERGVRSRDVRGLRNPAYRIVQFYPALLWPGDLPGALPIEADNEPIIEPIQQVWKWSNWTRKKQRLARFMPMLGDAFIKVVRPDPGNRVYFQLVDPAHVTDFETNERDDITYIRMDIPMPRRSQSDADRMTHVEIWDKATQLCRIWEVSNGDQKGTDDLGTPDLELTFESMGIDFVPVVHIPFMDIGELRGAGAFIYQIDKIDAVNADATRLAQMLYRHNKETLVFFGGSDAGGRTLPPPIVANSADGQSMERHDADVLSLPGESRVESLVPRLDYDAQLKQIESSLNDLRNDCPEMAYWQVLEMGANDVSGRALQRILGPAIARCLEARGNGEDGMVRAAEMALTLGSVSGTRALWNVGTYEQGDFEHAFEERPVIATDELEDAQAEQARAQAATLKKQVGFTDKYLMVNDFGVEEKDAEDMVAENAAAADSIGTQALTQFDRGRVA